jgi:hypothetical protein
MNLLKIWPSTNKSCKVFKSINTNKSDCLKKQSAFESIKEKHPRIKDKNGNDVYRGDNIKFSTFYVEPHIANGTIDEINFDNGNIDIKIKTKQGVINGKTEHTYRVTSPVQTIELDMGKKRRNSISPPINISKVDNEENVDYSEEKESAEYIDN